jgi:hypothetical protein
MVMVSPAAVRRAKRPWLLGDPHAPAEQEHEAADQEQAAEQAPFLRHCREDEIGMLLGQIVEMALGAVEEALAEDAAEPIAIFDCVMW